MTSSQERRTWERILFSVMKVPMVAGRAFTRQDTETSPKVAIINQALAKLFFPHRKSSW